MSEPVSLAEALAQCRVNSGDDDDFVTALIPRARAYVERETGFFWVAASRQVTFGQWGDFLEIYRRPVASIDSISYADESGAAVVVDTVDPATVPDGFTADLNRFPLRIYPAVDTDFPPLGAGGAITVSYTSGALDPASEEYLTGKQAMLLLIEHWYDNRSAAVVGTSAQASVEMQFALRSILDSLRPLDAY